LAGPSLLVVASLIAVYLVWSSTYLALRYVVVALPALLSAGARYLLAGGVLYGAGRLRGHAAPTARQWLLAIAPGTLLFLCGNGFVAIAEVHVASGLAAVACAAMPLLLAVFGVATGERPSRREWIGLTLGFGGVVLLGAGDLRAAHLFGLILFFAPVGWALGSLLSRRFARRMGPMGAAMQMIAGGIASLAVGALRGETLPTSVPLSAALAFVYLVVFGSIVAFSAYNYLLGATRPSIATSYAYVNPILAVVLGIVVAGERPGPTTLAAAALVVFGVAVLATGRPKATVTR
jgi:drug/metabolite transporter (DMT)-like permease